jgi:Skp family chaperone for outer membrane proteins
MSHQNIRGAPVQGRPWSIETIIRGIAFASLVALMAGLAVFNVRQWLAEGFVILAVVAACAELIGFVMAVMIEIAWAARRFLAVAVCGLILAVCAGFNVIGFERAWEASMEHHLEDRRLAAQAALDAERGELQGKLAAANARIAAYDYLLPDADTPTRRQAGMQAAWDRATAQARADAAQAQAELDQKPVVASVAAPFAPWQVMVGGALAELIKALGLWACGFGGALTAGQKAQRRFQTETMETPEPAAETGPETAKETPETKAETNVVSLAERAKALRTGPRPASYQAIAATLGCSKKHAWTLVNQR